MLQNRRPPFPTTQSLHLPKYEEPGPIIIKMKNVHLGYNNLTQVAKLWLKNNKMEFPLFIVQDHIFFTDVFITQIMVPLHYTLHKSTKTSLNLVLHQCQLSIG